MAVAAGPAWGYGYTTVYAPPEGEDSHLDIVNDIYSAYGPFAAEGLDFNNGSGITISRAYDFDSGDDTLHIVLGDETGVDQIWTDGTAQVTAQVKWAGLGQSFGWNQGEGVDGLDISNYYELLTDADIGGLPVEIMVTGDFLWGMKPNGYEWWSLQSLNDDGYDDHMVTYFVDGLPDAAPGEAVWLLLWEDLPCSGCDMDFNDFGVEVRAIPEPSAFLLVGGGLTGLAAFRRRRR